jgi:putative oxidoreductase
MTALVKLYGTFAQLAEKIPYAFIALVARLAAAAPFWNSGQGKLDGGSIFGVRYELFNIKASKTYLFANEFGFGDAIAPYAVQMAAIGENLLPPLLVFGFLSRFGAAGLLVMTAVIQFVVFPEELLRPNGNWSLHLLWATPLLLILARGPGAISLDAALGKKR